MMIEEIKKVSGVGESELVFDIPLPPPYQCLKIDKVKRRVQDIESWARSIQRSEDIKECHSTASEIEWNTSEVEECFEDLRAVIESLREWGGGWKRLAKSLLIKLPEFPIEEVSGSHYSKVSDFLESKKQVEI